MARFFQPCPDLKDLIWESVSGSTFRSFRIPSRHPAKLFREWAASHLSFSVATELREIRDQSRYDRFLSDCAKRLARYWLAETRTELPLGSGRKLLDLLFKKVIWWTEIPDADRQRLIPFLHVPLDKFSLAAVRQCAASGAFMPPIGIPRNASMGFVTSMKQYNRLQQLMQRIAGEAGVPPICIDLLAWNMPH